MHRQALEANELWRREQCRGRLAQALVPLAGQYASHHLGPRGGEAGLRDIAVDRVERVAYGERGIAKDQREGQEVSQLRLDRAALAGDHRHEHFAGLIDAEPRGLLHESHDVERRRRGSLDHGLEDAPLLGLAAEDAAQARALPEGGEAEVGELALDSRGRRSEDMHRPVVKALHVHGPGLAPESLEDRHRRRGDAQAAGINEAQIAEGHEIRAEPAQLALAGDQRVVAREGSLARDPRLGHPAGAADGIRMATGEFAAVRFEQRQRPEPLPAPEQLVPGSILVGQAIFGERALGQIEAIQDHRKILGVAAAGGERRKQEISDLLA